MLVHAQSINTQQFEILPTDKFKADFHSKMSVCRHELGGGVEPNPPPTIPTLHVSQNDSDSENIQSVT